MPLIKLASPLSCNQPDLVFTSRFKDESLLDECVSSDMINDDWEDCKYDLFSHSCHDRWCRLKRVKRSLTPRALHYTTFSLMDCSIPHTSCWWWRGRFGACGRMRNLSDELIKFPLWCDILSDSESLPSTQEIDNHRQSWISTATMFRLELHGFPFAQHRNENLNLWRRENRLQISLSLSLNAE
jgi:hypothetical protein